MKTTMEGDSDAHQWRSSSHESVDSTIKKYHIPPHISVNSIDAKSVTFEPKRHDGEDKAKQRKKKHKQRLSKSASLELYDGDREEKRKAELKEWLSTNSNSGGSSGNPHHTLHTLMVRHMRSVDDVEKLEEFHYEAYVDDLLGKIKRQREDIQRQTEELMNQIELKKLKQREATRHLKKRKPRSSLHNDNTFLDSLPKTRMYKISALERKLWNEGKFKTIEDSERFWDGFTKPENDGLMFGGDGSECYIDTDSQMHGTCRSMVSTVTYKQEDEDEDDDWIDVGTATLGLIREVTEPALRASTGGRVSDLRYPSATTGDRRKLSLPSGGHRKHPKVIEFEQRFPKIEFPQLAALNLNLEPPQEDPDASKLRKDFKRRAVLRHRASKRLNEMYEMSLAHLATTQRMLNQDEELSSILRGPNLCDVVCGFDKEEQLAIDMNGGDTRGIPAQDSDLSSIPNQRMGGAALSHTSDELEGEELAQGIQIDQEINELKEINKHGPFPLTLDALMEKDNVVEPNRTGVFWYNYGKFLPSIVT